MSGSFNPRRLLEEGDELDSILKNALEAERADDIDRDRLDRIGRNLAATAGIVAATPKVFQKTSWLASKGPFVVVAAAIAIGAGALVYSSRNEETAGRSPSAAVAEKKAIELATATVTAQENAPVLRPQDLPSASPVVAPKSALPATPTEGASQADEIALLALAQQALQGQPAEALALSREHETKFGQSHFVQEREAVAIEALVYLGRRDEAQARFTRFEAQYPSSSHRAHLAHVLSSSPR